MKRARSSSGSACVSLAMGREHAVVKIRVSIFVREFLNISLEIFFT
jgi:hypothetical protein